jgi:hypothetical protein
MCYSCDKVLPKIGLELGNPTVTFIGPTGIIGTMHMAGGSIIEWIANRDLPPNTFPVP